LACCRSGTMPDLQSRGPWFEPGQAVLSRWFTALSKKEGGKCPNQGRWAELGKIKWMGEIETRNRKEGGRGEGKNAPQTEKHSLITEKLSIHLFHTHTLTIFCVLIP